MASVTERLGKNGKVTFQVRYRINGEQRTASFASINSTKTAIKEARKNAETFSNEIEAQKTLGIKQYEVNMTFKNYSEQFMKIHLHNKRPNTIENYTRYLRFINDVFGRKKIEDITPKELDEYFFSLKENGLKLSSMKLYRDVFNLVFKAATKQDIIAANPMTKIMFEFREKNKKKEKKYITEETLKIILNSFQMDYYIHIILLGIMTGLRLGELCALTWNMVDFNNRSLQIRHSVDKKGNVGPTKTESSARDFYIYDNLMFLMSTIEEWQNKNKKLLGNTYHDYGLVICKHNGEPLKSGQVSKTMYEKSKTYGVHFTMHMLRHTFATTLKTANLKDVQSLLGHANADITVNTYQENIGLDKSTVNILNQFNPTKYLK